MYEFKKTEDQELLLESLKEVYERNDLDAYFKECDEKHEFPQKAIDVMVDAGFATLGIPEQYGGTEVDILTQCMVVEQACALGFPNLCWMNFACEVDDMLAFGSPEQQAETMKNAMTGTKPFSLGFTEPNAGSDNSAMSTRAEHRDGKVYINGQKTFITYADRVPYMLLMARNYENEIPQKDMSMYWLPMNTPGVKVTPLDKIGQHMINSCEVYLENVVLDESALVGKKGRGFFQLMKNFEVERLMSTAMNVGMAQAAYEEAARYATERVQFGKTIGSFQLTQEKIINMAIKIENMRNMVYHYAWMKQNGMSIATESAMAKYYTSRAAFEVVDDAMQMICFTCPHQLDLPEEIEARLVDKMMVTAEKYIPGLSEHIIIKEVLFNSDIMTASGKGGAGIGIGQVAGQTGAYRPKIKLPVEGAYVVGAAAGGAGVGTELAVNSAIEFFDNYCK